MSDLQDFITAGCPGDLVPNSVIMWDGCNRTPVQIAGDAVTCQDIADCIDSAYITANLNIGSGLQKASNQISVSQNYINGSVTSSLTGSNLTIGNNTIDISSILPTNYKFGFTTGSGNTFIDINQAAVVRGLDPITVNLTTNGFDVGLRSIGDGQVLVYDGSLGKYVGTDLEVASTAAIQSAMNPITSSLDARVVSIENTLRTLSPITTPQRTYMFEGRQPTASDGNINDVWWYNGQMWGKENSTTWTLIV